VLLLFFLTLALVGGSIALLARAAALPRLRTSQTLGRIGSYGFSSSDSEDEGRGAARAALDGVAVSVGGIAGRFGGLREASIRRSLVAAGIYDLAPRKFLGYRVLAVFSAAILWLWLSSRSGHGAVATIFGTIVALAVGWIGPITLVNRKARRRAEAIDYELPNLIDLLVVAVEAGLGFTGSLQLASERFTGPVGNELRLTLQEMSMGLSTNEALRNLVARCNTPLMRSFVRSVLQGETLGVSIGQIMRDLALDMRKRRRAAAEERAQKAPVKLLFPLVFLIFPAMFVVLLGPAVFSFLNAFGG
jgi:tight adherence protein C